MFWNGVTFWRRRLLAFLEDCCSVFEVVWHFGEAACSGLEGCTIFGGRLQCFGEAGGTCAAFWRGMLRVQYLYATSCYL